MEEEAEAAPPFRERESVRELVIESSEGLKKQKPHHPSEKKIESERELVIKSFEGLIQKKKKKQMPHHPPEKERARACHRVF